MYSFSEFLYLSSDKGISKYHSSNVMFIIERICKLIVFNFSPFSYQYTSTSQCKTLIGEYHKYVYKNYLSLFCKSWISILLRNQSCEFPFPVLSCHIRRKCKSPRQDFVLNINVQMLPVVNLYQNKKSLFEFKLVASTKWIFTIPIYAPRNMIPILWFIFSK